jgi:hypothetical protein
MFQISRKGILYLERSFCTFHIALAVGSLGKVSIGLISCFVHSETLSEASIS